MATVNTPDSPTYHVMTLPPRRKLAHDAALAWLREGYRYFGRARGLSLAYGGIFAAIGMLITWLGLSRPQFVLTFWTGFLLVGPVCHGALPDRAASGRRQVGQTHYMPGRTAQPPGLGGPVLAAAEPGHDRLDPLLDPGGGTLCRQCRRCLGVHRRARLAGGNRFLAVLFGVGALFAALMFALTAWSLPLVLDAR